MNETTETTLDAEELAKREKHARDMQMVLEGMDRAIQWIKDHKEDICSFHIMLQPNRATGAKIWLSFADDQQQKKLKKLFGGKTVTKKTDRHGSTTNYTLVDHELSLTFEWDVWYEPDPEPVKEEVVI